MKQEFEMTTEEMDDIIAINKNMSPVMKMGDHWSGLDLTERINDYWKILGAKYGFEPMSVEPHPNSPSTLRFIADPAEKGTLIQVAEEISTVSFELAIIDEKEAVKLTPELIRQKSKALTDLKIISIFDDAGYTAVKAANQKAIKTRTAIEKKEKEVLKTIKTRHTAEIKEVTDYTAALYIACREAQTALEAKMTAIDNEKAIAAKKLADDLKAKTEGRENKMYELGMTFNGTAFVGYGKAITKENLYSLADENYEGVITELEALQLEQSVTGEEKPAPVNTSSMTDAQHQTFINSGGYGKVTSSTPAPKPKTEYPTAILDYILENGQRLLLTKGTIEQIEDHEVINMRVAESAVYLSVLR